jgi:chromosome segregation ATPase
MKPDPSETAAHLLRLRQQLLLAEVRIMELEDDRDELAAKLSDAEKLRAAAQALADLKVDEAGHLERVRADLQAQFEHQRHLQHVTNEALNEAQRQIAAATDRQTELSSQLLTMSGHLAVSEERNAQLQQEIVALADQAGQLHATISRLGLELAENISTAAARQMRIGTLDGELRAMKASRSWRWTRWLRSLERRLGPRK